MPDRGPGLPQPDARLLGLCAWDKDAPDASPAGRTSRTPRLEARIAGPQR
jgi:hypothetical protein